MVMNPDEEESSWRALEERYRRIVELSPDAILLYNQGHIVFSNPAGTHLLGARGPEELVGKPVLDIVQAGFIELARERMRQAQEQGVTAGLVHEKFVRLDGTEIDVEVTSTALRFHDPGTGLIVFRPVRAAGQTALARIGDRGCDLTQSPVVHSPAMHEALARARSAAGTDATILLLGETGTGKELVADYIHSCSERWRGPMVKVNCAALPEHLVESELFGHERGSFTGAEKRRIGRFELAEGGTLFLDEVGELTMPVQVKLLRVLQERTVERIGSGEPIPVDIRLICATNRELRARVEAGQFRADLFYRINVVPLRLPPLRERREDVLPLARYFFDLLRPRMARGPAGFAQDAMAALTDYAWPGNVRELRNAVECALALCKSELIHARDLPQSVRGDEQAPGRVLSAETEPASLKNAVHGLERRMILEALHRNQWDVEAAARDLSLSRTRMYARLKEHGIRRRAGGPPGEASRFRDSVPPAGSDFGIGSP